MKTQLTIYFLWVTIGLLLVILGKQCYFYQQNTNINSILHSKFSDILMLFQPLVEKQAIGTLTMIKAQVLKHKRGKEYLEKAEKVYQYADYIAYEIQKITDDIAINGETTTTLNQRNRLKNELWKDYKCYMIELSDNSTTQPIVESNFQSLENFDLLDDEHFLKVAAFINQTNTVSFSHIHMVYGSCSIIHLGTTFTMPTQYSYSINDTLQLYTIVSMLDDDDVYEVSVENEILSQRYHHIDSLPSVGKHHQKGFIRHIWFPTLYPKFDTTYYPFEFYYEVVNDLCP